MELHLRRLSHLAKCFSQKEKKKNRRGLLKGYARAHFRNITVGTLKNKMAMILDVETTKGEYIIAEHFVNRFTRRNGLHLGSLILDLRSEKKKKMTTEVYPFTCT